ADATDILCAVSTPSRRLAWLPGAAVGEGEGTLTRAVPSFRAGDGACADAVSKRMVFTRTGRIGSLALGAGGRSAPESTKVFVSVTDGSLASIFSTMSGAVRHKLACLIWP